VQQHPKRPARGQEEEEEEEEEEGQRGDDVRRHPQAGQPGGPEARMLFQG
jgi:hypothetical protein